MPLETLDREINIRSLAVEAPKKPVFRFDVDKEITDGEWTEILSYLRGSDLYGALEGFALAYMLDSDVGREIRDKIEVRQNDIFEKMKQELGNQHLYRYAELFAYSHLMRSDIFSSPSQGVWDRIEKEELPEMRSQQKWFFFLRYCFFLKLVSPDFKAPELLADEKEALRNILLGPEHVNDGLIKIFYPELILNTEEKWNSIRTLFEQSRKDGSWLDFIHYALQLKIIQSKEVRFSPGVVEFIEPDKQSHEEPKSQPVPDSLNF